jgi:hypothetical protein
VDERGFVDFKDEDNVIIFIVDRTVSLGRSHVDYCITDSSALPARSDCVILTLLELQLLVCDRITIRDVCTSGRRHVIKKLA